MCLLFYCTLQRMVVLMLLPQVATSDKNMKHAHGLLAQQSTFPLVTSYHSIGPSTWSVHHHNHCYPLLTSSEADISNQQKETLSAIEMGR